jgi:hypothetical protein
MRMALAVMILMIACLLASNCQAEDANRFKSLGGDYGRSIIGSMTANQTPAKAANDSNGTLWNWGTAPTGSMVVGGKLVDDPSSSLSSLDVSSGAVRTLGVDTFTGNTIYYYAVPDTSVTRYFYVDPYSGNPVYLQKDDFYVEGSGAGSTGTSSGYALPSAFR